MRRWLDTALDEGVRFFVSSLGNPRWTVDAVEPVGGLVYHDVTNEMGAKGGRCRRHGLIAVNDRAGGHAGSVRASLLEEVRNFDLPVGTCRGIADAAAARVALNNRYDSACRRERRFIAHRRVCVSRRVQTSRGRSRREGHRLTDRITAVPVAVINNERDAGRHRGRLARQAPARPAAYQALGARRSCRRCRTRPICRSARMSHRDYFQGR